MTVLKLNVEHLAEHYLYYHISWTFLGDRSLIVVATSYLKAVYHTSDFTHIFSFFLFSFIPPNSLPRCNTNYPNPWGQIYSEFFWFKKSHNVYILLFIKALQCICYYVTTTPRPAPPQTGSWATPITALDFCYKTEEELVSSSGIVTSRRTSCLVSWGLLPSKLWQSWFFRACLDFQIGHKRSWAYTIIPLSKN